jgi:hypothetical protein
MRRNPLACVIAVALCSGLLAACGKAPERDVAKQLSRGAPPPQPTTGAPANTPANVGVPSPAQRQAGASPVQGQVDPKQPEQRKDFQRPGEQTGPGTLKPGG